MSGNNTVQKNEITFEILMEYYKKLFYPSQNISV